MRNLDEVAKTAEERALTIHRPRLSFLQLTLLGAALGVGSLIAIVGLYGAVYYLFGYWAIVFLVLILSRFFPVGALSNASPFELLYLCVIGLAASNLCWYLLTERFWLSVLIRS